MSYISKGEYPFYFSNNSIKTIETNLIRQDSFQVQTMY